MKNFKNYHKIEVTKFLGGMPMITGQLERAFQLAEKHKLDVSTILDLSMIIRKEINSSSRVEEKVLQQLITILENNKTFLREAT